MVFFTKVRKNQPVTISLLRGKNKKLLNQVYKKKGVAATAHKKNNDRPSFRQLKPKNFHKPNFHKPLPT